MTLPIRFRPIAQAEFDAAVAWYEQARPGLGADFAAEVEAVLAEAARAPNRFPVVDGDVREGPVRGFPYCAYYRVRAGRVVVVGVYHQARDPSGWRGRV